jgi:hypothetical protein
MAVTMSLVSLCGDFAGKDVTPCSQDDIYQYFKTEQKFDTLVIPKW